MGLVASEGREFARVVDSRGTAEEFSGARERYAQQQRPRAVRRDDVDGGRSMADHPLFRGLLEELPARNAAPSQEWLDRWASTARSILDLLYSRDPLT